MSNQFITKVYNLDELSVADRIKVHLCRKVRKFCLDHNVKPEILYKKAKIDQKLAKNIIESNINKLDSEEIFVALHNLSKKDESLKSYLDLLLAVVNTPFNKVKKAKKILSNV